VNKPAKGPRRKREACFPRFYEPFNKTHPQKKKKKAATMPTYTPTTPTTYTPTQTFPTANADATGDFILFWYFPPPTKGGRGGVGARSSSSKNPQLPQQQQRAPGETR
jgi:hypothetical protein